MLAFKTQSMVITCPHCLISFPVSAVNKEYYAEGSYAERCPYCGEYL